MSKTTIGILFIFIGWSYGSLAIPKVNYFTIGYLLKNGWIKQPLKQKTEKELLGSAAQIIIFTIFLNLIGIYLIWNRNI